MEIKEHDEFKVVGFKIESTVQECRSPNNPMPKLWERFLIKCRKIKNIKNKGVMYGPCFTIGNPQDCKFKVMAAIEVESVKDLPEGMTEETIPKGKYAVYEHKGKVSKIGETYGFITEDLKKQGMEEKGVWFELYDDRYVHENNDSVCEIWCGLK